MFFLVAGYSTSKAAQFEFQYNRFEASAYMRAAESLQVVCNVRMTGDVVSGDLETLRSIVAKMPQMDIQRSFYPRTRLCLRSPGGSYEEALKIAEFILEGQGIGTATVPDGDCFSACAIIFIAGSNNTGEEGKPYPDRLLHVTSRLGFHAPYLKEGGPDYDRATLDVAMLAGVRAVAKLLKITSAAGDEFISQSLLSEMLARGPDEAFLINTVGKAIKYKVALYGNGGAVSSRTVTSQMLCFASRYAAGWTEWNDLPCKDAKVVSRKEMQDRVEFKTKGAVHVEGNPEICTVSIWKQLTPYGVGVGSCGGEAVNLEDVHFHAPQTPIDKLQK